MALVLAEEHLDRSDRGTCSEVGAVISWIAGEVVGAAPKKSVGPPDRLDAAAQMSALGLALNRGLSVGFLIRSTRERGPTGYRARERRRPRGGQIARRAVLVQRG